MFRFAAPLACFPLALLLSATAADTAGRRPATISTLNGVYETADIPGVTYPRKAPPDLVVAADAAAPAPALVVLAPALESASAARRAVRGNRVR